ncbi:transposase [Streptomyces olivaceoviridis]|uniref:transposase n=1 Tax=Streptomyces olivaceoviridis TaxID=1921 RepID=UPI001674481E
MGRLRVPRRRGHPRTRPDLVLADKAYSSHAIREHLRKRGIRAVIPVPGGPTQPPAPPGRPRRQATGLRPRDPQAAQHRRAVHRPPQAVARHRHPVREGRAGAAHFGRGGVHNGVPYFTGQSQGGVVPSTCQHRPGLRARAPRTGVGSFRSRPQEGGAPPAAGLGRSPGEGSIARFAPNPSAARPRSAAGTDG